MKCTLTKDNLTTGLRHVLSVVSTKTALPVTGNVLLEAEEGKLTLTTTDLEMTVTTGVEAVVETPGSLTVPAKKFGQIASVLSGGDVTLGLNDAGFLTVCCQRASFRLATLSAEEFPRNEELSDSWQFTMSCADFRDSLAKVAYATSPDDSRWVLCGLLLSLREGTFVVAATDTRRLALVEKPLIEDTDIDGDAILPPKIVGELVRSMPVEGQVSIEVSETRIAFRFGPTLMCSKLIEGAYPDYRKVIPAAFSGTATMQREELLGVLHRVGTVIADMSTGAVTTTFADNRMTVKASSTEFGDSEEPFDVVYTGEELEKSFNPAYLTEPLKNMRSDEVQLQFNADVYTPVALSGDEGFLCVIMPMRS